MEAKTEENVDAIVNGIVELKTGEEKPVPVDVIPTPVSDLTELNGFRFVCVMGKSITIQLYLILYASVACCLLIYAQQMGRCKRLCMMPIILRSTQCV